MAISADVASCIASKRPDIADFFRRNGSPKASDPVAMITEWWSWNRAGDGSASFATPEAYAKSLGCVVSGGGGTPPTPGGPGAGSGDLVGQIMSWVKENQTLVIIGVAAYFILGKKR